MFTQYYDIISKKYIEGYDHMLINPYTPGAGRLPSYLAGRDQTILDAKNIIEYALSGYPQRPIVYYGLRGVGKTVLLNQIEEESKNDKIIQKYIEIKENDNFKQNISSAIQMAIHKMSFVEATKDFCKKVASSFKAFSAKWSPETGFSFGFDCNASMSEIPISGLFDEDLKEMLLLLGDLASKSKRCICFYIDEIQYMKKDDFEALVTAIHRVGQKRLPLMFFGAGLPKILKMLGDSKSYTERLFDYIEITSLKEPDAKEALVKPALELGIEYEEKAVDYIINCTGCYPYFIQQFGEVIWNKIDPNYKISHDDAVEALPIFLDKLDNGFFKVRYDRTTNKEKRFMYSMVKCGRLPCSISQICEIMGDEIKSISPFRSQLINKGLIYSTGHGELDFTVPQFDSFIRRINSEI
jgi:hypothetical protein